MENTPSTAKKKLDFSSYGVVIGFLCLEILAFVSFYLGRSFILYGVLSLVLAALALLVTFRQINKDGITTFAFFIFPLFVFGLLTALSSFNYGSIGAIGVAESIFVPIGLTFISLAGFLTGYIKGFKIKTAMLIIYCALALFVFINLIITMIYYVPFYTLIYRNSYIFYDGKPSALPIGSMAYMLFGFQIKEVTLEYWTLFPSLLLTAVIPLFFIKYKTNRREFVIYAVISGIAFLSLLFTISRYTLITDLILVLGIAMIIATAKFKKTRSIFNGVMISVGIVFLLVCIVMFLAAQTSWGFLNGFRKLLEGNSLLNRLFVSNRYASSIIVVFQDLFSSFKLFGVPVGGAAYEYPNGVSQKPCNIWLFDNLLSSGLFGSLFFIAVLVIGIRRLFKYIKAGDDNDYVRYLIAAYILGYLVISLFLFDITPLVNSSKLSPFYTSAPLLICIFLLSYAFNQTLIEGKESKLEKKEEEKEEIKEDETIAL